MLLRFPSRTVDPVSGSPHGHLSDTMTLSDRPAPAPIVVLPHPRAVLVALIDLAEEAKKYAHFARAANTLRAYQNDWRDFRDWCLMRQLDALPAAPETVALYLADLAHDRKASTLQRRISAISTAHQAARLESPTKDIVVRTVMAGIRRKIGVAQEGKTPTLTEDIRAMVAGLLRTHHGLQERALLLLGFAGAFRRSELVALDVADLQFTRAGLVIHLRRSKTDQEGQGRAVGIPHGSSPEVCPVRSLKAWLKVASITSGPIFRGVDNSDVVGADRLSDKAVARAVKRGALRAGLDPDLYAGHSLRAGLATSAAAAGASERSIMNQTGHKSEKMVRRYIREANIFRENAAASAGL